METSVSVDDVISLDESVSIDSVGTLSPTHYIEKATNVAMSYLPSTNEVIDQVANRATVAKDVAQNIAADTVHRTRFVIGSLHLLVNNEHFFYRRVNDKASIICLR